MKFRPREIVDSAATLLAVAAVAASLAFFSATAARAAQTYVMKLSTATVNDTQQEWLQRFAAAVEKDSGGRIKGEIYNASKLGSIPRQIEGTQFGSIQAWIGPPEFLVGVDERYEALSAPGLFTGQEQDVRVLDDPAVHNLMLGLGANKGLTGIAIMPTGPSSIVVRKDVHHLADFKGMKMRVLASPFQLEMIKRMDASPVAMSLGDVLPALQQGAIDGALGTMSVFVPLHYYDTSKFLVETGQPFVNVIVVMNKKWLETLPADLQKIIHDDTATVTTGMVPFAKNFYLGQRKLWTDQGGKLISLPADEQAAYLARISSIGADLSKDKPALAAAVKTVMDAVARSKVAVAQNK